MAGQLSAVVIGAGPNGLAAAIRLAENGHPVTVLEAADRPGGAVRTEELTLPGFHHDTFSAVYPAGAASPVFARMPLERHGLRWIHPDACYAHPLPGGGAVALYREVERTAASLDAVRAGDGARWRAFVAPLLDSFDARILDLQTILRARSHRSLRSAGRTAAVRSELLNRRSYCHTPSCRLRPTHGPNGDSIRAQLDSSSWMARSA